MSVSEFLNEKLLAQNIEWEPKNKLVFDFDEVMKKEKFFQLLRASVTPGQWEEEKENKDANN